MGRTRRMMNRATGMLAGLAVAGSLGLAASGARAGEVSLTVYSSADPSGFDPQAYVAQQRGGYQPVDAAQVPGFGVVRDTRELDLGQGMNTVSFTDVAQFIDPTTVSLMDLSAIAAASPEQAVKVVEQKFQFDLVSPQKLLQRYIDQPVTVNVNLGNGQREAVTGKLLSNNQGQLVLQTPAGLRLLSMSGDVQLGQLPQGLITRPTLEWQLWSPTTGRRSVRTSYQTSGLTWRADYNLVLSSDETKADLGAWVTLLNLSGVSYADARLKLVAGDVQRVQPQGRDRSAKYMTDSLVRASGAPAGFEEKSFFEYHLYTLPRPTTVASNSTQQLALFPTAQGVRVEKVLVYYGLAEAGHWFFPEPQLDRNLGQQSSKKVDVYVKFDNKEANKLGLPLPRGKVRVYKMDAPDTGGAVKGDGSLEFIGEDLIDHTSKNETVLVKVGQSFDVTGERTQVDFKVDVGARWMEETIRIKLRNAKNQEQKVVVRENLYRWMNWEVTRKSHEFTKVDARTAHFDVDVPAEGEKVIEYTVKYTW